jgi:RNA methyltransferase, TrmH family
MITSTHNARVQWVRQLQGHAQQRHQENAFIVEGVRLVEEAHASVWQVLWVASSDQLSPRGQALVEEFRAQGIPQDQVSPQVMTTMSDTQTPQGILAALALKSLPLPKQLSFAIIADGIRDPGNLGTMLRSAAAAGVEAVLLPPNSVDAFAPKVVRSAMGAHFRLPIINTTWPEIKQFVHQFQLQVYLAAAHGGVSHTAADFSASLALIIGGEAEGAGSQAESLAASQVHIRMPGAVESLNAAAAAAILMFEVVRQRDSHQPLANSNQ